MNRKMRCRRCQCLNYDFLSETHEWNSPSFCGLHGRIRVNPDGPQQDLDHRGGCGFIPSKQIIQLELFV
jgi:hypothetical protein